MSAPPVARSLAPSSYSRGDQWDDASPCPICGHDGWCRITRDRQMVLCRRARRPDGVQRRTRTGSAWLHKLTPGEWAHTIDVHDEDAEPGVQVAPDTKLDAVYRALIAACPLTPGHLAALQHRGFVSDADLAQFGSLTEADPIDDLFRSLGGRRPIDDVPGFYQGRDREYRVSGRTGLLIPVRNADGLIVRMRVRVDDAGDGGKYRYLSAQKGWNAAKSGVAAHVPLAARALAATDPTAPWVLTEGEFKAERVCADWRRPAIGIPGVGAWDTALPILRAVGAQSVVLAWDADARTNPAVAAALRDVTLALSADGHVDAFGKPADDRAGRTFAVSIVTWDAPAGADGKPSPKGIDDALAAGVPLTTHEGLAALEQLRVIVDGSGAPPDPAADAVLVVQRAIEAVRQKRATPQDVLEDRAVIDAVAVVLDGAEDRWPALRERLKAVKVAPKALQDAARALLRQRQREEQKARSDLPRITVTERIEEVGDAALDALAQAVTAGHPVASKVYTREGQLVRVSTRVRRLDAARGEAPGQSIEPLPIASLLELLSAVAEWGRTVEGEGGERWVPCLPPIDVVRAVHSRGDWPQLRGLEAITNGPILRPDGTVLDAEGYDESTGILHTPPQALLDAWPGVPDAPGLLDAQGAAWELLEIAQGFPFAGPQHRASFLAYVLALVGQYAIGGPSPMGVVDGNGQGVGKGTLLDVVGLIALGAPMPKLSPASSPEEWSKTVQSVNRAGTRVVLIDNVKRPLSSEALDVTLTSTSTTGRVLGESRMETCPNRTLWFMTANNTAVDRDLARRCLRVRLETDEADPADQVFLRPDILADVARERPRLLAAALTILRAFHVAGRPRQSTSGAGFPAWTALVRDAVRWVTGCDPAMTMQEMLEEGDIDRDPTRVLLTHWNELAARIRGGRGCTAGAALALMTEEAGSHPWVREALATLCRVRGAGLPDPHTLGMLFRRLRGRPVEDRDPSGVVRRMVLVGTRSSGNVGTLWWVETRVVGGVVGGAAGGGGAGGGVPGGVVGGGGAGEASGAVAGGIVGGGDGVPPTITNPPPTTKTEAAPGKVGGVEGVDGVQELSCAREFSREDDACDSRAHMRALGDHHQPPIHQLSQATPTESALGVGLVVVGGGVGGAPTEFVGTVEADTGGRNGPPTATGRCASEGCPYPAVPGDVWCAGCAG